MDERALLTHFEPFSKPLMHQALVQIFVLVTGMSFQDALVLLKPLPSTILEQTLSGLQM